MDRSVPPLNVSPLIKGARYTFLICGVMYGVIRRNYILGLEAKLRPEEERKELEEQARKAAHKQQLYEEENRFFKENFGG